MPGILKKISELYQISSYQDADLERHFAHMGRVYAAISAVADVEALAPEEQEGPEHKLIWEILVMSVANSETSRKALKARIPQLQALIAAMEQAKGAPPPVPAWLPEVGMLPPEQPDGAPRFVWRSGVSPIKRTEPLEHAAPTREDLAQVRASGMRAAQRGADLSNNPWEPGPNKAAWADGWMSYEPPTPPVAA